MTGKKPETRKGSQPSLYRILDVSSAHITKNDDDVLRMISENRTIKGADSVPFVAAYDEGLFVMLSADQSADADDSAFSEGFQRLIRYAYNFSMEGLRIDANGAIYENLKQFDW